MECPDVRERLPWLLNGSLEAEERAALASHLAGCPGCRIELEEARSAGELFGAHLSADTLVALAWHRPPANLDRQTANRHLENCPSCREDLALLRESQRLELESDRAVAARGIRLPQVVLRSLAAAACLVAGVTLGVRWDPGRRADALARAQHESTRLSGELAAATAEAGRLRAVESELRTRLDGLNAPIANLPVVEVLPGNAGHRSPGAEANVVVVPRQPGFVAFVLSAERKRRGPAAVELRDDKGRVLWRVQGLLPSPLGGYTLGIPTARLPEGRASLAIVDERASGGPTELFEIRVRKAP